ncbi:type I-U CRISPR-associated protein Cas5/Cas6 [Calidifontibacter sp. DB0510]|uniref:Type I-U CRISPR-associated protein Cas5/Cas6 n=1 Tax=Metallococcus carri TaxID=1656884 RepID=A0A967E9C8_9MICO|nr:type I-U CRISPR-associated protein Csb2 [Metallococcus carri]NHN56237.1 type I-U CRISPR-associated protein Cas5/Cas6 [Metallococcus carri]NOP38711.1 type I-U CRISPR-associated protein Cas5/Cas6 [Calidifontibacter sp. DB2511S]
MTLVIEARFPLGQYLAHDGAGFPEWPPSPARLAAATVAAAYRMGEGIEAARRFCDLDPPTIVTPMVGMRDGSVSRWVPVDNPVDPDKGTIGRGGLSAKIAKPPERGTVVGDAPVRFEFVSAPQDDEWRTGLGEVLRGVPYLGRPTSPVLLRVASSMQLSDGGYLWEPDRAGDRLLPTANRAFLEALDERERERERSGVTGHHPRLAVRPVTRYRRVRLGADQGDCRPATLREARAHLQSMVYIRTAKAEPADIRKVIDAFTEAELLLPVYGVVTKQGLEIPRLFGVLAAPAWVRASAVALGSGSVVVRPELPPDTRHVVDAVRTAWGEARAWTTAAPLKGSKEEIADLIRGWSAGFNAKLVQAQSHSSPRLVGPEATEDELHVSLLFDRPLSGPLVLNRCALIPFALEE